jgi:predicted nuclease of predicted toxin-antitoxin system
VKLLIDNALSPHMVIPLQQAGHDTAHVREYGMQRADDSAILERAEKENRVVVSADTDFGTLLALRQKSRPSVVLFRGPTSREPARVAARLLAEIPLHTTSLESGCILTIEPHRSRVRRLPIGGSSEDDRS